MWDTRMSGSRAEVLRAELATARAASLSAANAAPQLPPVAAAKPYDASAREMLAQHATPWPQLLDALEAAQLTGVRVVNVDYTAAEAQARVEIAFTQQPLVLEYAAMLNAGIPSEGMAWRWSVARIEQSRSDSTGRATLVALFAQR
jgi:hypothetical protein